MLRRLTAVSRLGFVFVLTILYTLYLIYLFVNTSDLTLSQITWQSPTFKTTPLFLPMCIQLYLLWLTNSKYLMLCSWIKIWKYETTQDYWKRSANHKNKNKKRPWVNQLLKFNTKLLLINFRFLNTKVYILLKNMISTLKHQWFYSKTPRFLLLNTRVSTLKHQGFYS